MAQFIPVLSTISPRKESFSSSLRKYCQSIRKYADRLFYRSVITTQHAEKMYYCSLKENAQFKKII
jgi:hypothetical protein